MARLLLLLLFAMMACNDIASSSSHLMCGENVGCQAAFVCDQNTNQCVPVRQGDTVQDGSIMQDSGVIGADAARVPLDTAIPDGTSDDSDGDSIANGSDNCPNIDNADQLDRDDDGLGDACDARPNHTDLKLSGHFLLFGGLAVDDNHTLRGRGRSAHGVVTDGELRLRGGFSP